MDSAEETRGAASDLADLDRVPLADLQVMHDAALSLALSRIVPQDPSDRLGVAAFNSAI
jgi:FXSXX-COOH protein